MAKILHQRNSESYTTFLIRRFMHKVSRRPNKNGCLLWRGKTTKKHKQAKPYGEFILDYVTNKRVRAHVFMFELVTGHKALEIHHRCGETLCVTVTHLENLSKSEHTRITLQTRMHNE